MTTVSHEYDFDRRDEAEMFFSHEKEQPGRFGFEVLDHDIRFSEDYDRWILTIQYAQYGEAA